MYTSQNDLEKKAQETDKLIPQMDSNMRYNNIVALNEAFVLEIMSIPRVGHYMYVMLKQKDFENIEDINESKCYKEMLGQLDDLSFKNLFNSFNFSKKSRQADEMSLEEEKLESKTEIKGTLLPEDQKNEKKMFIFANVFVLLNRIFIKSAQECLSAALAVLDS